MTKQVLLDFLLLLCNLSGALKVNQARKSYRKRRLLVHLYCRLDMPVHLFDQHLWAYRYLSRRCILRGLWARAFSHVLVSRILLFPTCLSIRVCELKYLWFHTVTRKYSRSLLWVFY